MWIFSHCCGIFTKTLLLPSSLKVSRWAPPHFGLIQNRDLCSHGSYSTLQGESAHSVLAESSSDQVGPSVLTTAVIVYMENLKEFTLTVSLMSELSKLYRNSPVY